MMMRGIFITLLVLSLFGVVNAASAQSNFKGLNIIVAENATSAPVGMPTHVAPTVTDEAVPAASHEQLTSTTTNHVPSDGRAEGSSGLPQFNPASWPSQIFWLTLIFGTFYVLSSTWIVPKMAGIVSARADYISANLKEAENLSNQAQHIKDEYETSLKQSQIRATDSIKSVQESAKQRLSHSITEFRQKYEAEIDMTEQAIGKAKTEAMNDMNKIVATVASSAAEKIAGVKADTAQAENVVRLLNDKKAKAA
jgi:F-type H+-transporting ATPase subunit b